MKSQVKIGTVFGVELGLHYSWLVIALLITFSLAAQFHAVDRNWSETQVWGTAILTGVLFFAGLFAHELSHALVAKARGLPIHRITLFMLGGVAQIEKEATDPSTEFWMAIVGPFTSAAIGFLLLELAHLFGWTPAFTPQTPGTALLVWLGYINLGLAVFNMIPGFPLDGGRVLRAILWWAMDDMERATRAAARVGQAIAVLFIGFGIFRFFEGAGLGGLWIAFIGWFLLQAAGATYMQVRAGSLLSGIKVRDLMSRDCAITSPDTSLQEFVQNQLMPTGRRCFLVMENGALKGLITPNELRNVNPKDLYFKKVGSVMLPAEKIRSVSPDTPAREALETMLRENVNQLPVMSDGHVQGVITQGQILQAIRFRSEIAKIAELPRAA
jgi:Zn-dependent protease